MPDMEHDAARKDRGSLLLNFLVTAAGTIGSQIITFAALPILSRLYSPAEFGDWALFMSAAFAVPVLAGLRYEIAIVVARTDRGARRLLQAICIIGSLLSLAWIVLIFGLTLLGRHTGLFHVPATYYLIALMIFANGIFQSGLMWWTRRHRFGRIAAARTIQSLAMVATQLLLAVWAHMASTGLILGTVAGQLAIGLYVYWLIEREDHLFRIPHWDARHLRAVLWRYRRMPLFAAPYTLQGQAFMQAVVAILGNFGSVALAGQYAVSQRTVYYPMTVISTSLSQALLPRMAQARDGLSMQQDFFVGMIRLFLMLLTPLYVFLLFFGEPLAAFALGEQWRFTGRLMAWLFLPSMLLVTGSWFERIFDILDRQRVQLGLELGFNVIILAVLGVSMALLDAPQTAIFITSTALGLYYVAWLFLAFHVAGFSRFRLTRELGAGLATFLGCYLLLKILTWLATPAWAWALLAAGAVIYYAVLIRRAVHALQTGFSAMEPDENA